MERTPAAIPLTPTAGQAVPLFTTSRAAAWLTFDADGDESWRESW